MSPGTINTLAFGIVTSLLVLRATARLCDANEKFFNFNSSKTVSIPALRLKGNSVVDDPDNSWYFSTRTQYGGTVGGEGAMTHMWLNTGKSNATGIGTCWQTTWTYGQDGFSFSRDVLERSADDKGDCKTMLGEECVAGLIRHFQRSALKSVSDGTTSSCSGEAFNSTIPQECASLVGGGSKWRGGLFGSGPPLDYALDEQTLIKEKCPKDAVAVNSSIHAGGGTGGAYNETVRFAQPYFLTFWPNRTDSTADGATSDDVRVELLCLRMDDIEDGSPVPGSAKDILDEEGVKYEGNATDETDGTETGSEGPSSTKGVAAMKTMGPYLGAAAMAGLLLM
ncbi:hypothetical protein SLS60_001657 [Paraconiothyrium brasiliense]|uniref:Uncharacterized protein n=1 Tax=Paraconiothyrium brasiliense TaxID=300254 RepID=A0ABR3RZZ2_9PLEO